MTKFLNLIGYYMAQCDHLLRFIGQLTHHACAIGKLMHHAWCYWTIYAQCHLAVVLEWASFLSDFNTI